MLAVAVHLPDLRVRGFDKSAAVVRVSQRYLGNGVGGRDGIDRTGKTVEHILDRRRLKNPLLKIDGRAADALFVNLDAQLVERPPKIGRRN